MFPSACDTSAYSPLNASPSEWMQRYRIDNAGSQPRSDNLPANRQKAVNRVIDSLSEARSDYRDSRSGGRNRAEEGRDNQGAFTESLVRAGTAEAVSASATVTGSVGIAATRLEQTAGSGDQSQSFSRVRSAMREWEALNPEWLGHDALPAPIAAYKQVEYGATPSLGLSLRA